MILDGLKGGNFAAEEWNIAKTSPYLRHVNFMEIEQAADKKG
jgi:hypothetical protein